MMRNSFVLASLLLFCCMSICTTAYAGNLSYGINVGISVPQGDGSELWNLGYSINGGASYLLNPYMAINARTAFNSWTPDEDKLIDGLVTGVSGNFNIFEFIPAIQIYPLRYEDQAIKPFFRGGFGVYYLDYEISTTTFDPLYSSEPFTETNSDTDTKLGTSMGIGTQYVMTSSVSLELLAQYHIIFTEDEKTKYFAVTAGLWF